MSMKGWNPFWDIETMRQAMDRWFDERLLSNPPNNGSQNQEVAIDVNETQNGYELTAAVPGVRAEDIEILINRDTLTLRGKGEQLEEGRQGTYVYRERYTGSFQRTIRLPGPINAEQVDAELDLGLLKITLLRLQEASQRRVQVRSGTSVGSTPNQNGATLSEQVLPTEILSEVKVASPNQNEATLSGQEGGGEVKGSSTIERLAVLNKLNHTEMDSLEHHVVSNDEYGFGILAHSYGWDQQTTIQVWSDMISRSGSNEVRRTFESLGGVQGSAAQ
ncbi:MAG: Hsp20/alpha crystallin family protein [Chloroflexota bacterium]